MWDPYVLKIKEKYDLALTLLCGKIVVPHKKRGSIEEDGEEEKIKRKKKVLLCWMIR